MEVQTFVLKEFLLKSRVNALVKTTVFIPHSPRVVPRCNKPNTVTSSKMDDNAAAQANLDQYPEENARKAMQSSITKKRAKTSFYKMQRVSVPSATDNQNPTNIDREIQIIDNKRKRDNEKNKAKAINKPSIKQPIESTKMKSWQRKHRQTWDRSIAGMHIKKGEELFYEVFPGTNSAFFWEAVPLDVMKGLIITFTSSIFKTKCDELRVDISVNLDGKDKDCSAWNYALHWDQYDLTQYSSTEYLRLLKDKASKNEENGGDDCVSTFVEDTRRPSIRACKLENTQFDFRYQKGSALDTQGIIHLETIESLLKDMLLPRLLKNATDDEIELGRDDIDFFFVVIGTRQPAHQQLHSDNIYSTKLAAALAKEGTLMERSLDVGFVLHMPLMKEGMALRLEKKNSAGVCQEIISIRVPFGSAIVARADLKHSGVHGSPGNKRLHAAIVPKSLKWLDGCLDFQKRQNPMPGQLRTEGIQPVQMIAAAESVSKHVTLVSDELCNKYKDVFNRSVQKSTQLATLVEQWEKSS